MPVTNYYHIASVTIPSTWIALIVACAAAYIGMRMKFGKNHAERFGDAVFSVIIIWKLSVIITHFNTVIHAPISIVYFNGGLVGFCLGLAFVAFRFALDMQKGQIDRNGLVVLFAGAVAAFAIFQVMMTVLNSGSIFVKLMTVIVFLGVAIIVWRSAGREDGQLVQLALLVMAGHTFVAAVQPKGIFQPAHLVTLAVSLFFIIMFMKESKFVLEKRGNYSE